MTASNSEYETLERSIDTLIQSYQRVKAENVALQKKMQSLNNEKILLSRKNEEARHRVEGIIKSLKQSG